jgi:predicted signal transduction protein with EAL and GGDEF domain
MIVEMARTFGMETIAEGVETQGQAALREEMGCDMAQGFLFSEPLAAEGAANLLDAVYHRNPPAVGDERLRTVGPRILPEKLHARTVASWLPGY